MYYNELIGTQVYLVKNKRYKETELIKYLEGIGTVFIQPQNPTNEVIDPRYIGYIDTRPVNNCQSYFYGSYWFIFPSLLIDTRNPNTTYKLPYGQIDVSDIPLSPTKISRLLLEDIGVANHIVSKTIIEIDDLSGIDQAKSYISELERKQSIGLPLLKSLTNLFRKKSKIKSDAFGEVRGRQGRRNPRNSFQNQYTQPSDFDFPDDDNLTIS